MNHRNWTIVTVVSLVAAFSMVVAYGEEQGKGSPAPAAHAEGDGHDHAAHAEGDKTENTDKHDAEDESGHKEEEGLRLTAEQRQRFRILVQAAGPGNLRNEVSLPGEIVFNQDRLVHLTPRVAGVAREVLKTVGDRVKAGEVMAVIESRELADAKAEYLAAKARAALAEKVYNREKVLREQKVSSEQDLLDAEQAHAEARIVLRSSEQKLHALGLPEQAVAGLDDQHDETITRYEVRAPIEGVIAARHISLGESLESDSEIFTVVDTSSVWVNLTVHMRNLAAVRTGQDVVLRADHDGAQALGKVGVVTPFVEESVRSATARVVLDNTDGCWIPGTFVTGLIAVSQDNLPVVVPRHAVQSVEGRDVVFVEHEGAFEMTPVVLGRSDRQAVEIVSGLDAGSRYVAEGAFQLKATVVTSALGSHAGHGH